MHMDETPEHVVVVNNQEWELLSYNDLTRLTKEVLTQQMASKSKAGSYTVASHVSDWRQGMRDNQFRYVVLFAGGSREDEWLDFIEIRAKHPQTCASELKRAQIGRAHV